MSDIYDINTKHREKNVKKLNDFLIELDSICDKLYNRLEFSGVWDVLLELEDVRVRYYVELYEQRKILELKRKRNVKER